MPSLPSDYAPPTPVFSVARSASSAMSQVRKAMDNLEATAEKTAGGLWTPVAVLRPDQEYLKDRLQERGIKCRLSEGGAHVSELMIAAGVRVLEEYVREGFSHSDTVRAVYTAMERQK